MKKILLSVLLIIAISKLNAQTPRVCLYEEFTGETCPPCASTNPGLNALLASPTNTPKVVAIKWQVPIPSAPSKTWSLYQTNKVEIDYRWMSGNNDYGYNPPINSAPSGKMDGQEPTAFGAGSSNAASLNNNVIATAQSYTSAFSITLNRAWNKTCSAVNLTVSIVATANFTSIGGLKLRTVMVERLIQFSVQPGTNGETTFEDVAIKSFPSLQAGTPIASTWTVGQALTFTLSCPIPAYTRDKNQIAMVCFIQDDGSKKVAQTARADKMPLPSEAVAAMNAKVNVSCSNTISSEVTVRNDGTNAISTLTINPYSDGVLGNTTSWSGNLATGASTTIILNPISTSTTQGVHTFSFNVDLSSPIYNLTYTANKVNYMVANNYTTTDVNEGFVISTFPPTGWVLSNPNSGNSWARAVSAGGFNLSPSCMRNEFFNNSVIGDKDELYLPPFNFLGAITPSITFDVAYAQRDAISDDKLEVMASDNCGLSWTTVYTSSGLNLSTTLPTSNYFVPTVANDSEWRNETAALTGFNKTQVLVKFVTTSDNGNNLYVDNVNLYSSIPSGITKKSSDKLNVDIYPNPTKGELFIKLNTSAPTDVKLTVINVLGQTVISKTELTSSKIKLDLKTLEEGIYLVEIKTNTGSSVKKIMVEK